MIKTALVGLIACVTLTGCKLTDSNEVPVKSVTGTVISSEVCQAGHKCEAVIARDPDNWTYQIAEGPFKKGDTLYKACAYYPTYERCSSVWSSRPDQFIPPESKK